MAGLGRCLSMPVLVVAAGLCINYYVVLFLLIRPWLSFTSVLGFLHTLLFTILNGMLLISYGLAVARDPGYIPASYTPDLETSAQNSAAKAKERRFCDKCQQCKPPRAHHCRVCKRCVLRMDHHCIWMNNCVGHKNYKAFLLVVLYSCGTCLYSLALVLAFAILQRGEALSAGGFRVLYTCFTLMGCLVTSSWLAWNAHLLLQNKTTIEYKQGKRESWIAEKAGQMYRHPYDLGAYANLISVLGPKLNYWLCPMSVGHIGSGVWSRTLSEHHLLLNGVGEQPS